MSFDEDWEVVEPTEDTGMVWVPHSRLQRLADWFALWSSAEILTCALFGLAAFLLTVALATGGRAW